MEELDDQDRNLVSKGLTQGSVPAQMLGWMSSFEWICQVMGKILGRKVDPWDRD